MTDKAYLKQHGLILEKLCGNIPTMYGAVKKYGQDGLQVLIMKEKKEKSVSILVRGRGEWRKYFEKEATNIKAHFESTKKYSKVEIIF